MGPGQGRMGTERLNPINLSISAGLLVPGGPGAHPQLQAKAFPPRRLPSSVLLYNGRQVAMETSGPISLF